MFDKSWSIFQDVINDEYVYPVEVACGFKTKHEALEYMKKNNLSDDEFFVFECKL